MDVLNCGQWTEVHKTSAARHAVLLKQFPKSTPFKNNIVEVNTVLRLTPNQDVKHKMMAEINFTSLVTIENKVNQTELEKIVLVKVPTEVYPTLYETFVYLFSQAGLKNISIEKEVNFEKMYNEKKKS